jgi:hypothetical protein
MHLMLALHKRRMCWPWCAAPWCEARHTLELTRRRVCVCVGGVPQPQAVALVVLQCMEAAALVNLLQTSLGPYQPLPAPWFQFDWVARDAALIGLGGSAAALLAVGAQTRATL